ncbi:MAG: C-terminal binding protein [Verrucomicrobiota bacterium]|nr:C-terminal binding protein [Verrucomicrobiota bacterium]
MPNKKRKPLVAVLDWKTAPSSNSGVDLETRVLGKTARVKYFLTDNEANFSPEILKADALIIWQNANITENTISRMKHCRALIRNGVGYDSVDIEAAARAGIPVCNVPDYGTEEVADHAIALSLALTRQLFSLDAEAKKPGWKLVAKDKLRRTSSLTFGVVGLGRIGTAAALRAKALGFNVIFYDPYLPSGTEKAIGIKRTHSLNGLLKTSDVVSIHCPLNEETHYLIAEQELSLMKPSAYLVNTARGGIIKKKDVLSALRKGVIAGAGLDVIENEPLKTKAEARTPNLIATCHAAFCSREGMIEMRTTSARIAKQALQGKPLENVVNGL